MQSHRNSGIKKNGYWPTRILESLPKKLAKGIPVTTYESRRSACSVILGPDILKLFLISVKITKKICFSSWIFKMIYKSVQVLKNLLFYVLKTSHKSCNWLMTLFVIGRLHFLKRSGMDSDHTLFLKNIVHLLLVKLSRM